jgi:signal transduction histidine kinase
MVENLCETSENLYALLENLLEWAQIQRGMMIYHPVICDLHEIIVRNIALFDPTARHKQITIVRQFPDEPFTSYADERVVDVVLRNLLSNALKFTPEQGQIVVRGKRHEHGVDISVSDTGTGISQADLATLFQIGQTNRHQGTAGEVGTGLGLILCKELLEANGGQIKAESELGEGSTFTIHLPLPKDSDT